jgi:hypothetical protein
MGMDKHEEVDIGNGMTPQADVHECQHATSAKGIGMLLVMRIC